MIYDKVKGKFVMTRKEKIEGWVITFCFLGAMVGISVCLGILLFGYGHIHGLVK